MDNETVYFITTVTALAVITVMIILKMGYIEDLLLIRNKPSVSEDIFALNKANDLLKAQLDRANTKLEELYQGPGKTYTTAEMRCADLEKQLEGSSQSMTERSRGIIDSLNFQVASLQKTVNNVMDDRKNIQTSLDSCLKMLEEGRIVQNIKRKEDEPFEEYLTRVMIRYGLGREVALSIVELFNTNDFDKRFP